MIIPTWRQYEQIYNYEVPVPVSYWETGNSFLPRHTRGRIAQMQDYERLFDGDYSAYFDEQIVVPINYHQFISNFLAELLMSFPPALEEELDFINPRFLQMLNRALQAVIGDMVTFGTGMFHITEGPYGAEVYSVKPTYFFPDDDGNEALLDVPELQELPVHLWISHNTGDFEHRVYENRQGHTLGEVIEDEFFTYDPALWDFVGENNIGRIGTIINVAREPSTGDFGRSLYRDITGLAFEIVRRLSQNSEILRHHGNPRDLMVPNPDVFAPKLGIDGNDAGEALAHHKKRSEELDVWRNDKIVQLPPGYTDMRQMFWQGSLDSQMFQIEKIQEQLFAMTKIPSVWYLTNNSQRGGGQQASGRALQFQFMNTYIYLTNLQSIIISSLRKCLMAAVIIDGGTLAELERLADTDLIWPNVLDQMDEENEVVLGEEAETEQVGDESAGSEESTDNSEEADDAAQ